MDANLEIPALRGVQATQPYFVSMVNISSCVRIFDFMGEIVPTELRTQRIIDLKRVAAIAAYIASRREDYVVPPIVALVNGVMRFQPFSEDFPNMGQLLIGTETPILIADGQHRIKGLTEAIEEDRELAKETIVVVFFPFRDIKSAQTIFADINRSAKPTPQSLNLIFDHSDEIAETTRKLLQAIDLYDLLCEKEKNSASGRSPYLFPFKDLYKANKIIYQEFKKQKSTVDPDRIIEYWEFVSLNMPSWIEVREKKLDAFQCRQNNISSHGIAIEVLGHLGAKLLLMDLKSSELKKKLSPLGKFNWKKSSPKITGACLDMGKVKKTRETTELLLQVVLKHLKIA